MRNHNLFFNPIQSHSDRDPEPGTDPGIRTAISRFKDFNSSARPIDCNKEAHLSPALCLVDRSAVSSARTWSENNKNVKKKREKIRCQFAMTYF